MPKHLLKVQNKTNEQEQTQTSSIITRLSSKRINTDESTPAKKVKIEEKDVDKENVPKRQSTRTKQRKSSSSQNVEPTPDKSVNISTNKTDEEVDDDNEEENIAFPIDLDDKGKEYQANKQYLIYENARPNHQPLIVSKTARYWSLRYLKVLSHVNPDAYGIYIHNDFSCYGELEVVENCLLDLTKTIFVVQQGIFERLTLKPKEKSKVNYVLGFRRLEALTILLEYADGISGIDDGERFTEMIRVIGACYVTILRGLLPKEMFKKFETYDENLKKNLNKISKKIPNFKHVLEQALIIGHVFQTIGDVCSAYTNILQIIYLNWILVMENVSIDLNTQSKNDKLWNALKHASEIKQSDIDIDYKESFNFLETLRAYKENYGLGGDSHDLSKWSRSARDAYSYRHSNDFLDLFF